MGSIRTAQNLQDLIDREQAWRKRELATIRLEHDRARDHQKTILRRAGVSLLYAHLEGYIKVVGSAYVELVGRSGSRYRDLTTNFVALGAKGNIAEFAQSSRGLVLCKVADFFLGPPAEQKAKLSWAGAIETRSNVSAKVFRDIVAILGLDYTPFAVYEKTVGISEQRRNPAT